MMLFIQFSGGAAPLYSCTDAAAVDACAQLAPADPADDARCVPVDRRGAAAGWCWARRQQRWWC